MVAKAACAKVAELVDAPDLGSGAERRVGSSPSFRTRYDDVIRIFNLNASELGNIEPVGTASQHCRCPWRRSTARWKTASSASTRTVKMHGFRPGKVPFRVVVQQYGGQVRQEVLGDTLAKKLWRGHQAAKPEGGGLPELRGQAAVRRRRRSLNTAPRSKSIPKWCSAISRKPRSRRPTLEVGDAEIGQDAGNHAQAARELRAGRRAPLPAATA